MYGSIIEIGSTADEWGVEAAFAASDTIIFIVKQERHCVYISYTFPVSHADDVVCLHTRFTFLKEGF